jgi:hypothetical protein
MIKLRIDVDYPYPSRTKSFLYTAFNLKASRDYLKNSKIMARMINESPKKVKAYWFFTPKTIPDGELLNLLDEERHEVALHIVNEPYEEMEILERVTGRKLRYYTIHGTARLLARVIWKRWKAKTPKIPEKFPLESFYQFSTFGLDRFCYANNSTKTVQVVRKKISEGKIVHIHPGWLFQRGKINYRGPFYEVLRILLTVDEEMKTIAMRKKLFFKVASDRQEYVKTVVPLGDFIKKLAERGVDIFTFIERKWCTSLPRSVRSWFKEEDNIAILRVKTYDLWWRNIGKKTRNMVRKAKKNGIEVAIVKPNEKLAEGIWKIYNETPIRQERAFSHYGITKNTVTANVVSALNSTFIGAFFQHELIGFIQLVNGDKIAIIAQILSLQKHLDKAVNNALIAKAVEFCINTKKEWIMYGRIGNHPSLDKFKQNNGFSRFSLNRYFIPITKKGRIAIKLGLHRTLKDALPQPIKYLLIPFYNWISRNKMRIKLRLFS